MSSSGEELPDKESLNEMLLYTRVEQSLGEYAAEAYMILAGLHYYQRPQYLILYEEVLGREKMMQRTPEQNIKAVRLWGYERSELN